MKEQNSISNYIVGVWRTHRHASWQYRPERAFRPSEDEV